MEIFRQKKEDDVNWLCKMIGHKWLTCQRGHKDGKRVMWQTVWPACLRCGEPAPDALVDGYEDLSDAIANEAAYAARGFESVESYRRRMMRSCAEGLENERCPDCGSEDVGLECPFSDGGQLRECARCGRKFYIDGSKGGDNGEA
jgi:hypothetical protein